LRLLAGYVANASRGPGAAHARSAAEREATIARCEAALSDEADLERFRALVASTVDYVFVIEGRAHWQQNCVGALRPACLALGRKLADLGALASAEDVFHLRLAELGALAADPSGTMLETIEGRKAELEEWAGLSPPLMMGPPPPPPPADAPPNPIGLMFGGPAEKTDDPMLLKGKGASRGVVTGRARVAFSLEEAEALQAGEILVCPFTAPSWMPVFTTAAAIVTNQGGVLSHAAIEAREYGIPCVTGTESGTQRIPDGATVTVDGLEGTVRIHAD
jgi:pyruvate,water dikinase